MTTPAMSREPARAIDTTRLTATLSSAIPTGSQGSRNEKNVRVSSRFTPFSGRANANQNSASLTWSVDDVPNAPCW